MLSSLVPKNTVSSLRCRFCTVWSQDSPICPAAANWPTIYTPSMAKLTRLACFRISNRQWWAYWFPRCCNPTIKKWNRTWTSLSRSIKIISLRRRWIFLNLFHDEIISWSSPETIGSRRRKRVKSLISCSNKIPCRLWLYPTNTWLRCSILIPFKWPTHTQLLRIPLAVVSKLSIAKIPTIGKPRNREVD